MASVGIAPVSAGPAGDGIGTTCTVARALPSGGSGSDRGGDAAVVASTQTRRAWAWADLMRRVFAIDVLACAGCGGRLRFLATIEDPPVVTKILAHLGLPTSRPVLRPARRPLQPNGVDFA